MQQRAIEDADLRSGQNDGRRAAAFEALRSAIVATTDAPSIIDALGQPLDPDNSIRHIEAAGYNVAALVLFALGRVDDAAELDAILTDDYADVSQVPTSGPHQLIRG